MISVGIASMPGMSHCGTSPEWLIQHCVHFAKATGLISEDDPEECLGQLHVTFGPMFLCAVPQRVTRNPSGQCVNEPNGDPRFGRYCSCAMMHTLDCFRLPFCAAVDQSKGEWRLM